MKKRTKQQALAERRERLMPNGEPKYIRVYDNGGRGSRYFCRACLTFTEKKCETPGCAGRLVPSPPGSGDRYTVVYAGRYKGRPRGRTEYRAMSEAPTHPQGIGLFCEAEGHFDAPSGFPPALGDKSPCGDRRIRFDQLPEDCRKVVIDDYETLWDLKSEQ